MNRRQFETLLKKRRQAALREQAAQAAQQTRLKLAEEPSVPDTFDEWLDLVYWQHIDTGNPVNGITAIQADYLRNRSAFRWTEDGERRFGSDIIAKARRVMITSLVLAGILYACIRWREIRCVSVFHQKKTLDTVRGNFGYAVRHLPPHWRKRWRLRDERWEYVHEAGRGAPDVVSVWEPHLAGTTRGGADGLGRGGAIHLLHLSEAPYYRYPQIVWSACRDCVPVKTGWIVVESTLSGDPDAWMTRTFYDAIDERGAILRGHFWPWYADPLKSIAADDDRFERAMTLDVDSDDAEAERELGLTPEQVAYRRWYRCQGTLDEKWAARRELPEVPEDAAVKAEEHWLRGEAIERQRAGTHEPALRVRIGDLVSLTVWDHEPQAVAVGLYRSHQRGRGYASVIGLDPVSLHQVFEIHGRCEDAELVRGLTIALHEIGLARSGYVVAVGRPSAIGALDLLQRGQPAVNVDLRVPTVGQWVRLPGGTVELGWDHGRRLWAPRRGDGAVSGAPGWTTTGYHRSAMMGRLSSAIEDPDTPLRLASSYLVNELGELVVSDKTGNVAGPQVDLSVALALALMAAPDVKPASMDLSGLQQGRRLRRGASRRPGRPSLPT